MPRVSIIVPSYKPGEWFDACMASIEAQTYKDCKLILVEDKEGQGAAKTRNRGLLQVDSEFVVFCDDDDTMDPDAVEGMVSASDGADLVVGGFKKVGNFTMSVTHPDAVLTMPSVASYVMGNLFNPRQNQIFSGCWAKLYRRDFVGLFPHLTTAEDMAFVFDYLRKCQNVRFLSGTVYNNRKREGSLSTTFDERNKMGLFGFLGGLRYVERFLSAHIDAETLSEALDNSKVYHSMLYFMRICDQMKVPQREAFLRLYP